MASKTFTIYVVELKPEIWDKPKMRKRNPDRASHKPCVYVGYTVHSPEKRFEQHKDDEHASPIVRDYGIRLRPTLARNASVTTARADAEKSEAHWADHLRRKGFGVWEGGRGPIQAHRKQTTLDN